MQQLSSALYIVWHRFIGPNTHSYSAIMFSSENELKILGKATYLFLFSLEVNKEYPLCLKMAMSFIDFLSWFWKRKLY